MGALYLPNILAPISPHNYRQKSVVTIALTETDAIICFLIHSREVAIVSVVKMIT